MIVALERLAEVGLQDGLGWEDAVAFSAGALSVLTLGAFIFRAPLRRFARFLEWAEKFQQDWDGVPGRPGVDHTPGVMERLNNIDGEFKRNGGSTMKDSQFRTERAVHVINDRLGAVERTQRHNVKAAAANLDKMAQALTDAGHQAPHFQEFIGLIPVDDEPEKGS